MKEEETRIPEVRNAAIEEYAARRGKTYEEAADELMAAAFMRVDVVANKAPNVSA